MSTSQDQHIKNIRELVDAFEAHNPDTDKSYFVAEKDVAAARRLGDIFWLPTQHAYKIFLYAYSALFGIPAFTNEALARQDDRFSKNRLPLTIRSTSSFILDAFGYNRRLERPSEVLYWPSPVIHRAHGPSGSKHRISNPAMAYFAYHLIRAAEALANSDASCLDRSEHYKFVGDFIRGADYPFPLDRARAESFSQQTDHLLAGDTHTHCWHNILHAAKILDVTLDCNHLINFLHPKSSHLFAKTVKRDRAAR